MVRSAVLSAAIVTAVLGGAPPPAMAETIDSAYTRFDAKSCQHRRGREVEDYGTWRCRGYAGIAVVLSAGDQRMQVTFGRPKPDEDHAASQTFPGFNDVYEGSVEWRYEKRRRGLPRPFATILSWNVMTDDDREKATGPVKASGRVLVVTRLGPGGVCHVGYVDARADPDANALARRIADEHARTFVCGKDKRIVLGTVGKGVAMPTDE